MSRLNRQQSSNMVWTPSKDGKQQLAEENIAVDSDVNARKEDEHQELKKRTFKMLAK